MILDSSRKQATARLKQVDALIMEREAKILAKLADGAIGSARVVDEIVVNTKSLIRFLNKISEPDAVLVSNVGQHTESNPHFFEDLVKGTLGKLEGLNIGGR